jgi:purine-binding chemotaxis protein CheW
MTEDDRMDRAERPGDRREGRRGKAATREDDDAGPAELEETVERVTGATAELPDEMAIDESAADVPEGADADATADETDAVAPGGTQADKPAHAPAEAKTRVLEFALGEERFCIDIEYVEEIVTDRSVTRVPNTPSSVEGVVDLRGQITTILDPKVLIGVDDTTAGGLLVVFDEEAFEEGSPLGWVVDDVREVRPVTDADVTEAPVDAAHVTGVIDRGDGDFVVWTSPEAALEEAT